MRVGQGNQNLTPLSNIGFNSTKTASGLFAGQTGINSNEASKHSLPPFMGIGSNNRIVLFAGEVIEGFAYKTECELKEIAAQAAARNLEEDMARWDYINDNLFRKFGIDGQVAGMRGSRVPHRFNVFYIETRNPNEQNKVIIELENGKFVIGSTSMDWDSLSSALDIFIGRLQEFGGSLNVERLKNLFEEFLLEMMDDIEFNRYGN